MMNLVSNNKTWDEHLPGANSVHTGRLEKEIPKMDNKSKLQSEIHEANLAYLMLSQALLREDRTSALLQLGINEGIAQIIEALSAAQIIRLAQSNLMICRMRFGDQMVWSLLADSPAHQPDGAIASRLHASILMAGQLEDAL
jgi:flagellar transcriptional activator FlhD